MMATHNSNGHDSNDGVDQSRKLLAILPYYTPPICQKTYLEKVYQVTRVLRNVRMETRLRAVETNKRLL